VSFQLPGKTRWTVVLDIDAKERKQAVILVIGNWGSDPAKSNKIGGAVGSGTKGGRADGCAEHVVEVRGALRRRYGISTSDMRFIDEVFVITTDERETIPEE
jgi:hypothetical protein